MQYHNHSLRGRDELMLSLLGKVAIVISDSSRIGSAVSELFAQEGAKVITFCHCAAAQLSISDYFGDSSTAIVTVHGDASQPENVSTLFDAVEHKYGQIDILVNSLNVPDNGTCVMRTDNALWGSVVSSNQNIPFYSCRVFVKHLMGRSGNILNISGVDAIYSNTGIGRAASGAATLALTKNIARYYTKHMIRCNMLSVVLPNNELFSASNEDEKQWYAGEPNSHSSIAPVSADIIAKAALFLVSDNSAGISGQNICIDGGLCI